MMRVIAYVACDLFKTYCQSEVSDDWFVKSSSTPVRLPLAGIITDPHASK